MMGRSEDGKLSGVVGCDDLLFWCMQYAYFFFTRHIQTPFQVLDDGNNVYKV